MNAGDTKLGGGYVEIGARMENLHADLAAVKGRVAGLGSVFSGANIVAAGAIGAITATFKVLTGAVKEYTALEAAAATTNAVFGKSAGDVTAEADKMAKAFGVVKSQYLESANALGMTFKNMGMTEDEAAKLSMGLNQLAGDMAATFDKPVEEATNAIQAAFRGEFDSLERFGPQLSAARIEAEALANGFTKVNGTLTQSAKAYAALSLIQKESKDSQGAMVRESDQLGSRLKKVSGDITNMAGQLGGALAPAVNGFLGMVFKLGERFSWVWDSILSVTSTASTAIGDFFTGAGSAISSFADSWAGFGARIRDIGSWAVEWLGAAVGAVGSFAQAQFGLGVTADGVWGGIGNAVNWVKETISSTVAGGAMIFRNFGDVLEIVGLKFYEFGMNAVAVASTIPENLGRVGNWIANNWRELIGDGLNAVWAIFQNLDHNIAELASEIWEFLSNPTSEWDPDFKPLLDGFKATAQKLPELLKPELVSMEDEIAKVGARINEREANFGKTKPKEVFTPAKLDPNRQAFMNADAEEKKKMAGAASMKVEVIDGAANFARKIQESASGQGAQEMAKKQLDAANQTVLNTRKTAESMEKMTERRGAAATVLA